MKRDVRQTIHDLKEIIDLWIKFYNLIKDAYTNKTATKEEEQVFLDIKTALARKQQALGATPFKLMSILGRATTLNDLARLQDLQAKKFYTDWHETYLNLNEFLGRLESGKAEPEVSRDEVKEKREGRGCRGCLYNFILLIVFLILIYIALRIYDAKRHLISKVRETSIGENQKVEEMLQALGFKPVEESEESEEEGEVK